MVTTFANTAGYDGVVQGCQMVYFQTKNPNLGTFLEGLRNENVGKFYIAFWNVGQPLGISYGNLVHLVVNWYIFFNFGYAVPRKIWQPWGR
jgi:hypothetical protein